MMIVTEIKTQAWLTVRGQALPLVLRVQLLLRLGVAQQAQRQAQRGQAVAQPVLATDRRQVHLVRSMAALPAAPPLTKLRRGLAGVVPT